MKKVCRHEFVFIMIWIMLVYYLAVLFAVDIVSGWKEFLQVLAVKGGFLAVVLAFPVLLGVFGAMIAHGLYFERHHEIMKGMDYEVVSIDWRKNLLTLRPKHKTFYVTVDFDCQSSGSRLREGVLVQGSGHKQLTFW